MVFICAPQNFYFSLELHDYGRILAHLDVQSVLVVCMAMNPLAHLQGGHSSEREPDKIAKTNTKHRGISLGFTLDCQRMLTCHCCIGGCFSYDCCTCDYYVDDVIKLHLESLPLSASHDSVSSYFKNVGENVEVVSVDMIGGDKGTVVLSGLTDSGKIL